MAAPSCTISPPCLSSLFLIQAACLGFYSIINDLINEPITPEFPRFSDCLSDLAESRSSQLLLVIKALQGFVAGKLFHLLLGALGVFFFSPPHSEASNHI